MPEANLFLDEFRPFRRGEIALARKTVADPAALHPADLDLLRYAVRLAQLSSIGPEADNLVYRIGSFRLRLLQLLAPVLPTEPRKIEAASLLNRIPKVRALVERARRSLFDAGICSEDALDEELSHKRLALVLGGTAGSGYVSLGALEWLEKLGVTPDYMMGCSVGAILAVVRARSTHFDLERTYDEIQHLGLSAAFRAVAPVTRYGLPGSLRLDLRTPLGKLFTNPDGSPQRLADLPLPVDVLATGVTTAALGAAGEAPSDLLAGQVEDPRSLVDLPGVALGRVVSSLVALAMSRRVLVPVLFGADSETAQLAALDAAGFSAAIPGLLHYDLDGGDLRGRAVLDAVFERHELRGLVDGAIVSMVPARYAWEAIETGRIGSRNCTIVALDSFSRARGANAPLAPLLKAFQSTSRPDRGFIDLHVEFRKSPQFLDLFPPVERLRRAAAQGAREFQDTARVLRAMRAPLRPWSQLVERAIA